MAINPYFYARINDYFSGDFTTHLLPEYNRDFRMIRLPGLFSLFSLRQVI